MDLTFKLKNAFQGLSTEARELYLSSEVPVLSAPPTSLQFYRQWVSPNIPVIIKNAINHWPALKLWNSDYFREKIGDKEVTVAVTPNGYADAVVGDRFVMAEDRSMKMKQFLDILDHKTEEKGIFYIQKQNSNFTEEFSEIICDAELDIPWTSEAFGLSPDAVNFWMGDERAVTSMHKDHYENLYCVVSGTKTFILIPPTDAPFIPHGLYKPAKYEYNLKGDFDIVDVEDSTQEDKEVKALLQDELPEIKDIHGKNQRDDVNNLEKNHCEGDKEVDDDDEVDEDDSADVDDREMENENLTPWISIDPLNPDLETFPEYAKARPITCTVHSGETLFLPSLWFHHVQQSHKCIAVNFWYDMEYDIKYSYFKFLEKLTKL
ncbi:bifunctional peptidase and (3S)-lysyl hydroxylase Jmjd7-like [Actinia tenebrosa]|uniref:Bifunctional peptidase and (3S)-lysyl hydroxylase Jmjd7-like n=1 Tax=Actinia tenebrosa TaxID=6105 RepID=A0A6P8J1G9_ACTTE|nr:bifunctional peptidase and (3S)-lysyl hydroxylase Jmjd7-like [Actinia tenebrosa]